MVRSNLKSNTLFSVQEMRRVIERDVAKNMPSPSRERGREAHQSTPR